MPEHWICFVQLFHAPGHSLRRDADPSCQLSLLRSIVRNEFVERRIDEADRYRNGVHRLEYAYKITPLKRQQLVERLAASLSRIRQNHFLYRLLPFSAPLGMFEVLKEHMFRAD